MKKLSLFLLGFVATSFMASAQSEITPEMFAQPANTGANMTVGVNASKFDQFAGGQIGAFYDLNGDGTLQCVGLQSIETGFFGSALWGDDSSTPEKDGLAAGDVPQFAILHDGNVLNVAEIPQFTGYVTNGIVNITDAIIDGGSGCIDPGACNPMFMYSDVNYSDDGSCDFESCAGCLDPGACNFNADATSDDGSCDFESCAGCTSAPACNYDEAAIIEDGSCVYAFDVDACASCSGETDGSGVIVDNDADDDGVCDADEIVGCQDASACNYNPDATDEGSCNVPVGCDTCDGDNVVNNDADGDGVCDADEIVGCQNPSAPNYNPEATDQADEDSELACEGATIPFSTPGYPAHTVTSNNMSVLFPVNNAGLWNVDESNLLEGDLVAAFYTTATLDNNFLGYSATSAIANAGGVEWTGDQVGAAIFGADNGIDNGFEPGESLMWLVMRDGVVYNASATYATPGYDGTYEENIYVSANSLVVGEPFLNGCTNSNYMEYNPMASEDDGSCATYISVGCLDANFVNYAGADVDAASIHDNSENFGDAFGQNYTVDLNSGATSPSGVGANFHDVDVCQSQVPGCTYPYAHNYDSQATEDDGSCDWSAYSHHTFDAVTGVNTGTLYSFGGDDDDSNNEWVGSDFEYANDLYQDARMGTGHIVTDLIASYDAYTERRKADSTFLSDTLNDVAAWFAADEAADAQELADSLSDNYARFDAMFNHLSDSISATLDSAALAFAADEAADAQELADTINDMQSRYDAMLSHMQDSVAFTLDSAAVAFAADEAADAQELADTINDMQARYDANDLAHRILEGLITDSLNHHRAPIIIDLHSGWNTVAYYLHHESPVVAQFENQFGSEAAVQENINIVKNNEGLFYWPDFLFDGLGMLDPGQGYQVRVKDATSGKSDFYFEHGIGANEYRVLTPTVPVWAIEMEVEKHPNDVRTLVRVVNMLGQEVVPSNQFTGEVLLYMYNDGTVEKKMVE
jgi:hypothetical protein